MYAHFYSREVSHLHTRLKLLEMLDDPTQKIKLLMELAVIIDADEPFIKATYRLEGDGLLVFKYSI